MHPPARAVAHIGSPPIPELDLVDYVGQRSARFHFQLSDALTDENKGELTPLRDNPPTLTHDSTATIKRNLTMSLGVEDTARINSIRDRVDVAMEIAGVIYPLGRYLFVDQTDQQWTSGLLANVSLMDEMFIIDQPLTRGFAGNQLVVDAIRSLLKDLLDRADLEVKIESSGFAASGSWTAGTSRAQVLTDLCTQGGFFSPWFDNTGVLRIIRSFEPIDREPDIDLDKGNQVIRGTIANTTDVLKTPNRFVVISNGSSLATEVPIMGTYDVPSSAPHSIANRGFVIAKVTDMQLLTADQCRQVAATLGQQTTAFDRVSLSTAPDPRHDSYNVIKWQGKQWLELGWTLTLSEGAPMTHTLRRAYS